MSDKSSKNDEKGRYLKSYNMYEHDGTFEGHKKWRRAGAVFFEAKKRLFVLSLILTGAFDPTPLITTWPYEPEDWKPVIEGKIPKAEMIRERIRQKKKRRTHEGEADEVAEEIEAKENIMKKNSKRIIKLRAKMTMIEDDHEDSQSVKSYADAVTEKSQAQSGADEEKTGSDSEADERRNVNIEDLNENFQYRSMRSEQENDELVRLLAEQETLRDDLETLNERLNEICEEEDDGPKKLIPDMRIYSDYTDITPIHVTVQDLKNANGELHLWMQTTAPKLMVESIDADCRNKHVGAYGILNSLENKFGKDKTTVGNLARIGKAATLSFKYGKETASEYFKRMLKIINEIEGYPKLKNGMLTAAPMVFLGRIGHPKNGVYDNLAQHLLLNVPDLDDLCAGPPQEFAKRINSIETTMKCRQKTERALKEKKQKKAAEQRAASATSNGSNKGKKTSRRGNKSERANGAKDETPTCHNCGNKKSLLKKHNQSEHATKNCPFEPSLKTKKFFEKMHKSKIKVSASDHPDFANAADDNDKRSSTESESDDE